MCRESELKFQEIGCGGTVYQLIISDWLDPAWSEWLHGMSITTTINRRGEAITLLAGHFKDQAELRGILSRLWDLNLTVVSVERCEEEEEGEKLLEVEKRG